jgi:tRNA-2-methylthio-N6-dimethylallyladenosine synthase
MRRFYLASFGCQMNLHDAERIAGILCAAGWEEADSPQDADLVVFLTCSVRAGAEERFWGRLQSMAPLKRNRGSMFAVGGCMAQRLGVEIIERAPHVDLVFGTEQYPKLLDLLAEAQGGPVCCVDMPGLKLSSVPSRRREPFRSWVPVITGCNNFCSYCVVPYVRGRETSRPRGEILAEIEEAVNSGVKEVNLLGQNVDSYGRDLAEPESFPGLLEEVARRWPELWVRFLTSHPRDFSRGIVEVMTEHQNICRYIHLPLQSGSDRVLAAMRRGYSLEQYLEKAEMIRRNLPDASLSTDIMVGFPGETEEDFLCTMRAAEACRFDAAYTFIYSPRPGTEAAVSGLPEVPREVKSERFRRLAERVKGLSYQSNRAEVGKMLEVLLEGPAPRAGKTPYNMRGRTRTNKAVNVEADEAEAGEILKVRISAAGPWSLYATYAAREPDGGTGTKRDRPQPGRPRHGASSPS